MNKTGKGVSWLHRLAFLVSVMTFLMFTEGLLTLGAGTRLLIPHQQVQEASANPVPQFSGKHVHVFLFLAVTVALLTIVLALWLWKSNFPPYLKNLGSMTAGVMFAGAFAVFGPARELFSGAAPYVYVSAAQVVFGLTVSLALFTRTDWRWDEPKTPDVATPSLRQILVFATALVFVQPLLGEAFEQRKMGIAPHLVIGIIVTICSLWVLEMALTKFSGLRTFKISTIFLAELVGLQLFLGIVSYSMTLNARAVAGSQPGLIVMNITHAAVGMLVLATSLFVTFQGFKYFVPAKSLTSSAVLH